jgi:uncharacterized protein
MKLQPDRLEGVNAITRHEPGRIWVNTTPWSQSVLVPHRGDARAWDATGIDALSAAHFERVLELRPELLIFGSGTRLRFVAPALHRALIERGIGVETMDTAAACRTFNVLASEGRVVAAALLIDDADPA